MQTFSVCPEIVSKSFAGLCSDVGLVSLWTLLCIFEFSHTVFVKCIYFKTPQFPPLCTLLLRTPNKTLSVSLVTGLKYKRLKLRFSLCRPDICIHSLQPKYLLLTDFPGPDGEFWAAWNTNPAILTPKAC